MESQTLSQDEVARLKKIARIAETVIRKCIKPKYRLAKNEYTYIYAVKNGIENYQKRCYPMGLADERIVDYIVYQIYRYREKITSDAYWDIPWLFTDYAVDKYKQQFIDKDGKSGMKYYIDEWLKNCGVTTKRLLDIISEPQHCSIAQYIYMPSEESIKKRWLNTEAGFVLCVKNTTGWCPKSKTCSRCHYQERCINHMNNIYPELIRLRKELTKH